MAPYRPYAGEVSALEKKAKWHEQRTGSRLPATVARAGQLRYRAELIREGQSPPHDDPDHNRAKTTRVREMGGRSVEPEFKNKGGRPDPKEFAWR